VCVCVCVGVCVCEYVPRRTHQRKSLKLQDSSSLFSLHTVTSLTHTYTHTHFTHNSKQNELITLLTEHQLQDSSILVFANKADLPQAIPVVQMAELLCLDKVAKVINHIHTHTHTHTFTRTQPWLV
jgi:hypothetical protein